MALLKISHSNQFIVTNTEVNSSEHLASVEHL